MKFVWTLVALAAFIAGSARAAESSSLAPSEPITAQVNNIGKVEIAPHRAVYTMSLGTAKNGSPVTDVTGQMTFEWGDACDGWAVQQHMQLRFNYAQGTESTVKTDVVSWEAKDGKRYNFNVRRMTNDKETENYRGRATLDDRGGSGVYTVPKSKNQVALPADALFPSAHTLMILRHAAEGKRLFTRRVFDGSDETGHADISVFIGNSASAAKSVEADASALRDNPLMATQEWPIRLAFYKPDSLNGIPDYEMDLTLLANGVARAMRIDYGDFSVSGILSELSPLPPSGC